MAGRTLSIYDIFCGHAATIDYKEVHDDEQNFLSCLGACL